MTMDRNFDCRRAATLLVQAADGDAQLEQVAWLENHLGVCADCRAIRQLDHDLADYGDFLRRRNPPRPDARDRLLAPRRAALRWLPAGLAAAAATVLLGVALLPTPHPPAPATSTSAAEQGFVPIPYVPPLDQYESARVMRMDVSVAALVAAGYRVPWADPAEVVQADVLVGEDGRAHAVRLLAGGTLN